MFKCNYRKLILSFNEFHNVKADDMPQYGEFCLLELKDGRYTAGKWNPNDYKKNSLSGEFIRGTADTVAVSEVSKWHPIDCYDMTNCLNDEEINFINLGPEGEEIHSVIMKGFKSLEDGDFPKSEQYCLLILKNGQLSAGRWDEWTKGKDGTFVYAPALACHSMNTVWAWTSLSSDDFFEAEEESERERDREEELNRNPSVDEELFKYGTDIEVYYEKALERLKKEYPWATVTQMKKVTPYAIAPCHGKLVFGQVSKSYYGTDIVTPWTEGSTADAFIDFLCEYTKTAVQNSNPAEKFKYGTDISVYLAKAYDKVKKDYRWLDKKMLESSRRFAIKEVGGDLEFVRECDDNDSPMVEDCSSAERFIEIAVYEYQGIALRANPVVAEYPVSFGDINLYGWHLEKYVFARLKTGDYKVTVQAGDRVTGGTREFFITPYCFEAKTYEEFLDRYLEIVPARSFGLSKEALLSDNDLKKFLGYQ